MRPGSPKNLKTIWFEEQMLPAWAQLLDLATRLCPVPDDTRQWFSRFTNSTGVDDARTISDQCGLLKASIQEHKEALLRELEREPRDEQPSRIIGGWIYTLETILKECDGKKTCSWIVEGTDQNQGGFGGGDITLRRV